LRAPAVDDLRHRIRPAGPRRRGGPVYGLLARHPHLPRVHDHLRDSGIPRWVGRCARCPDAEHDSGHCEHLHPVLVRRRHRRWLRQHQRFADREPPARRTGELPRHIRACVGRLRTLPAHAAHLGPAAPGASRESKPGGGGGMNRGDTSRRWVRRTIGAAILIFVVLLPQFATAGQLFFADTVLVAIMFATSTNLLFGQAGIPSFGQAGFFGAGAYAAALAADRGAPVLLSLLLGTVVAALVGLLASLIAWRTTGLAFSMITLAFAQSLYSI